MATILIGWELGGGVSQILPIRAIARRLKSDGHVPVLALRDVVDPATMFERGEFPIVQAPEWRPGRAYRRAQPPQATFADLLVVAGFDGVRRIAAIVAAWDGLIQFVKPDLIIGEASPALWLAARGKVPAIAIGTGFFLPPSETPRLPPLEPHETPLVAQHDMLAAINEVQKARGAEELPKLPALFDPGTRFVLSLPTLDPYADHRRWPADGPVEPMPSPASFPPEDRVCAFSSADNPYLRPMMSGIRHTGLAATVYLRGASDEMAASLSTDEITVINKPVEIAEALINCSVVVHDAALNLTAAALSIGRPQVCLPRSLEQQLTAKKVEDLGCGVTLFGDFVPRQFATLLTKAANSGAFARQAEQIARDLSREKKIDMLARIVEKAEEIVAGKS